MALVREGNRSALVVVDMQAGVLRDAWDAPRIIGNVARLVDNARARAVPVIWIQHSSDELRDGSTDWQLVEPLRPVAGEALVAKQFNSSFEQTTLEDTLAGVHATRIVLAGAATNWCIRATAYAALDRGYDLTLVQDAHTTESIELAYGTTVPAAGIVGDLNLAMRWLQYPGRTNGIAATAEVSFE